MVNDLISRQAAIDAAVKMFEAWYGGSVLRDREIRARFDALPSAQPERKKGKWAWDEDGFYICSSCGSGYEEQPTLMGKPMFEYCPICGARMSKEGDTE